MKTLYEMKIHSKFMKYLEGEAKNSHRTISLEKKKKKEPTSLKPLLYILNFPYTSILFISLNRLIIKEN